jgi:hypothetical protein
VPVSVFSSAAHSRLTDSTPNLLTVPTMSMKRKFDEDYNSEVSSSLLIRYPLSLSLSLRNITDSPNRCPGPPNVPALKLPTLPHSHFPHLPTALPPRQPPT